MQIRQKAYLSEMGIDQWQLVHPERLQGIEYHKQNIDSHFSILLICPEPLAAEEIDFVQKVLQSFEVSLDQALITQPNKLSVLGEHLLTWAWFIGCPVQSIDLPKTLHSPLLAEVSSNPTEKKSLWQQIVALKES